MRRWAALAAAVLTIAGGLALRRFAGGWVAKLGGVALWATLVYWLLVVVRPRASRTHIAVATVVISFAVELFQLTSIPATLAARWPIAHLVLGSTFSPPDLAAYPVGVLLAWMLDRSAALNSPASR
jgi:hypothetical protein